MPTTTSLAGPSEANRRLAGLRRAVGDIVLDDGLLRLELLHRIDRRGPASCADHLHPTCELTMPLAGDFQWRLPGRTVAIRPGDLLVVPPQMVHNWTCSSRDYALLGCMVHLEGPGWDADGQAEAMRSIGHRLRDPELCGAFAAVCDEASGRGPRDVLAAGLRYALLRCVDALRLPRGRRAVARSTPAQRIVQATRTWFREHCQEVVGVRQAAAAMDLSMRHLNRCFRSVLRRSVSEAFLDLRLERAQRLLAGTDLAVAVAGRLSGFANASHFSRAFRRRLGCAPAAYRRRGSLGDAPGAV